MSHSRRECTPENRKSRSYNALGNYQESSSTAKSPKTNRAKQFVKGLLSLSARRERADCENKSGLSDKSAAGAHQENMHLRE
eukprot:CAMPEP_0185589832 /NCGR_PEP_ID=MMETSP0434-20130131/58474_1 /TAXON_ID=626734 ORGANISM="Favella taraikaensis, Strain Fe Narragansett Bay" /NCGR_SAMPLE_ID=MMETSP0434 /ASSEMBLY_ACC=CAM_ASM_000379 /LENGTH=81 /DNA_ID=CAMNT_0028213541 /DNA_START=565 /DNA_END=810 /DNA_ORIENTATION=-